MTNAEQFDDRITIGPTKHRRRAHFFAAVVAATCVLSGGTIAIASASGSGVERVRTIHIVTTLTSTATNSAGLGGPGDIQAQVFSFQLLPGVTGHIAASATRVSTSENLSHVAFVFPDGQIDAQAAIIQPPTHFIAAVLGGTEAYEGVGGEVVNNVISTTPLIIDRTIHLIYPHH